jgi:hypothetical protein
MLRRLKTALDRRSYRIPRGIRRALSGEAMVPVEVRADLDAAPPAADLYGVWKGIPGGHKWWHYFEVYERVFAPLRTKPIRFLEVGVYKGGSLAMWRRYLHPDSVIVGIDIDPACRQFDLPSGGVHVRIGSQADTAFLDAIFQEFGPFDAILDDGSHMCSHMIRTFEHAFLRGLTDDGIYLAEDTHSNFWREYRDQSYSFIDLCKDLVDVSHAHYIDNVGPAPFTKGNTRRVQMALVPKIGAQVEEIRFLDSIVLIQRRKNRRLPTVEHL